MLRRLKFPPWRHRTSPGRLQSPCDANREATDVIKGTNRRVVVVRSPDERIFEQAIFILREDYLPTEREGAKRLMEEARRAAGAYAARLKSPPRRRRRRALFVLGGAGAAAIAWLAVRFAGVLL